MKLRQTPDDFIVEEQPLFEPKKQGKFALYKVSKVNMTTFASEKVLAKYCDVPFNKIGFAGLKDTHARTAQYFSVETATPNKGVFKEKNVQSELIGFLDKQIRTGDLKGNRFVITVRDLREKEIESAKEKIEQVKSGVPNYFDSQRFGSLKGVEGFIAKDVIKGDYESAVKKVITATTRHQKAQIRKLRRFIEKNWGNWQVCLEEVRAMKLEKTAEGTVVFHLSNSQNDFKGAFRRTFKGIRELFFSAYQSFIWNECIKKVTRQNSGGVYSVEYEAGKLVFPRKWNKDAKLGTFPLVAPDLKTDEPKMKIVNQVLEREEIALSNFLNEEHIFVPREREIIVTPQNLEVSFGDDELNKHKKKATLSFELPKGAYATIITKALFEQ